MADQNFGFVCKKMRQFENCQATVNTTACGNSGINERGCHGEAKKLNTNFYSDFYYYSNFLKSQSQYDFLANSV